MTSSNTTKGFTLVELLVVLSIIAMLASVVLVAVQGARDKAYIASGLQFTATNYHSLGVNTLVSYNFNEANGDAKDSSVNGLTGTLTNAGSCPGLPTAGSCRSTDTPGTVGNSFYVNGTSYVTNSTLDQKQSTAPTAETVSVWIKPNSIGNYKTIAAIIDTTGTRRAIYMDLRSSPVDGLEVQYGDCSNAGDLITGIQLGKWQQITYTYNGTDIAVYINGKFVRKPALTITGPCAYIPKTLTVGYSVVGGGFDGLIDDFAIYTQALSAADIERNYAMEAPKHGLAVK